MPKDSKVLDIVMSMIFRKNRLRKKEGDFLAKAHYDRGALTLALAESSPGLRLGENEEKLEEIVHKDRSLIFMPSLRFNKVTSKEFTPTWHDVIQKKSERVNSQVSRWAIVFFADIQSDIIPTYEEAHNIDKS